VKVMTILGTRPEFIRLSRIVDKLDRLCDHVLVHTGQNYDPSLNDVFFRELGLRRPDYHLDARGSFGEQIGKILAESERVMLAERPDRFLVLGDTNSSLGAIMAKRLGIPVYHMEAGNRCYDDRVPEEVNRRIIDHSSDILMPYTERSRQNLLREGIEGQRIYVTGNPIYEVMQHYDAQIQASTALQELGLEPKKYFLVTAHRAENVDVPERLQALVEALESLHNDYGLPMLFSLHPRTRRRLEESRLAAFDRQIRWLTPLGFFDFVHLEKNALCVLSDSGTVQEECCILRVPNVTLRDTTERPETLEVGSNMLSGVHPDSIVASVRGVLSQPPAWSVPPEYVVPHVSETILKVVLGFYHSAR